MTINHIEILVEEPSMEAFLYELLPRCLPPEVSFSLFTYNGKSDLLRKLPDRLRGYQSWMPENYGILVVIDRDNADCRELKLDLEGYFSDVAIPTKKCPRNENFRGLSRIAIEELEAWYFGNWPAVVRCYPGLPFSIPQKAKYRHSDQIMGGTWEAFERVCKSSGLFLSGLRKVEAARAIGAQIDPSENTSPSFGSLLDGIHAMLNQDASPPI